MCSRVEGSGTGARKRIVTTAVKGYGVGVLDEFFGRGRTAEAGDLWPCSNVTWTGRSGHPRGRRKPWYEGVRGKVDTREGRVGRSVEGVRKIYRRSTEEVCKKYGRCTEEVRR